MDFNQIQELIKLVDGSDISELKIEIENVKISLKTKHFYNTKSAAIPPPVAVATPAPTVVAPPVVSATPTAPVSKAEQQDSNDDTVAPNTSDLVAIKSPMIGTFYRAPSPDKPPFVKIGDTINIGDTLCVVEAMKLFNEIEAEVSGKIVKVLINDAEPVEYDQPLFLIEPI